MNSSAIWNKLPKEIFQRLTKLREQEKRMQSVLFQKSSCVNYVELQEIGHMLACMSIMHMQKIEPVFVFGRVYCSLVPPTFT